MAFMAEPPTDKQIAFLKRLKYQGSPPRTKQEASTLIDASLAVRAKATETGKGFAGLTQSQADKALERGHREWLKERHKEIREQVKDDLADQREFERDLRKYGGMDPKHALAGWILRIGEHCAEAKHLDGLLVTVEDAKADPDLLPPYDTCREETCECEIEPVDVRDVPRGTRIAERVPDASQPAANRSHKPSKKSGCVTVVLMIAAGIVFLWATLT